MSRKPERQDLATPEEWLARQEALADFSVHALQTDDLQAVLDEAAVQVARGMGVEFSKILQVQPQTDDLLIRAGTGWDKGWVGGTMPGGPGRSAAGHALTVCEPVISDEMETDPRFDSPRICREHGIHSAINTPSREPAPRSASWSATAGSRVVSRPRTLDS